MRKYIKVVLALALVLTSGCTGNHLISNKEYLALVDKSFNDKKKLAVNRETELFSVFNRKLFTEQSEALKFMYAFMPLSDLADYNGDFFLANIDKSLRTKTETPWGKHIPEEIFLHYVLPCRINNENLDSFRIVYYDEILERIKGKDVSNAALEINHWCHEKVAYQAADIRTSAPISTILSARGRCGEESTFTVAALRTAGIPARQVYTPRWAHSDDNHAWVEIWIDGAWYYMGACEPEPLLDRGWFTEPARRAMLVNTKSFGASYGNENAINVFNNYTDVNNLSKYATTKKISVKVVDKAGIAVKNASVEYQLYNYAEFYPLAVVASNENGLSQFETGIGDLLIWARKDDEFDFKKISVGETDTVLLKLHPRQDCFYRINLDLSVPVAPPPFAMPSSYLIDLNTKRINEENTIRQKYIDSWIKPEDVKLFATGINCDSTRLLNIFERSMGNYTEIEAFLSDTPDSLLNFALSLLEILPDKDLRDIKEVTLSDHLLMCMKNEDLKTKQNDKLFLEYVLNPRIANELIVSWRSYFFLNISPQSSEKAIADPSFIAQYLDQNIKIADSENYYKTPITPIGVYELKVSDSFSRSICFVAICRSLGIPSRLEPGRNIPQYYLNGNWNDVYFADQKQPSPKKGFLKLISKDTNPVPEYYIHFTLARFENGRYNTLEYDFNKKISDFKEELSLPPGSYMLVTGNRLNDSKILSGFELFNLAENEHKTIEVKIRRDFAEKMIIGTIDLKKIDALLALNKVPQSCSYDKGVVIIWIDPDKEPTKHIFNDLPLLKPELDAWGGQFIFMSDSRNNGSSFNSGSLQGLPANTTFGFDNQLAVLMNSVKINPQPEMVLPYIIVSDKYGNILFTSSGYRIGIGEQILKYVQ